MPSINDLSIAINSLFLDITNPITLALNKSEFLKNYRNTVFRFDNRPLFEFQMNPIFRFDDELTLRSFLNHEKELMHRYQDYSNKVDIEEMLEDINSSLTIDDLYINYTIELDGDDALIVFNTNSLVFKYEVIG